jgi:multicomponent Na+:H+ antiporter subunit G
VTAVDVVAAVLLLAGGALACIAGLGLVRLPDVASRLQAATKPQTLGLLCVAAGVAPLLGWVGGTLVLVLVAVFQLVTAPVLAQLVGRAAHRDGAVPPGALVVDELAERDRERQRERDRDRERDGR